MFLLLIRTREDVLNGGAGVGGGRHRRGAQLVDLVHQTLLLLQFALILIDNNILSIFNNGFWREQWRRDVVSRSCSGGGFRSVSNLNVISELWLRVERP